jgi:MoaA/NifB/PqqE/SkfB family radical SAM enzyme
MNVVKINSQTPDDLLVLKLMISDVCNYKCWYCFPGSNAGEKRWPNNTDLLKTNLSHLIEYYKTNAGKKQIRLHIIGGEPTLWPELGEFAHYFTEKFDCKISMSTNASRTLRWWNEFGSYFHDIILSCHHQEIDVEHVKKVGDLLYEKNVLVRGYVMMDSSNWRKCVDVVEQLKTSKHSWNIHIGEVVDSRLMPLTLEQKEYFKNPVKRKANFFYNLKTLNYHNKTKNPLITFENNKNEVVEKNWLLLNEITHFKGWSCNIGVDNVYIDKFGTVTGSCNNLLYNLNYHYNIYDNNFVEDFNPEIKSTICQQQTCSACIDEVNLKKSKF